MRILLSLLCLWPLCAQLVPPFPAGMPETTLAQPILDTRTNQFALSSVVNAHAPGVQESYGGIGSAIDFFSANTVMLSWPPPAEAFSIYQVNQPTTARIPAAPINPQPGGPPVPGTPVTVPAPYSGYTVGSSPAGDFGFEWGGAQYLFLTRESGSSLAALVTSGADFKVHALRSVNSGATWNELDAADAPDILPRPSGAGGGFYTVARDGDKALVLWVNHRSYDGTDQMLGLGMGNGLDVPGLSVTRFDLTLGAWTGATKSYYGKLPPYPWHADYLYRVGSTLVDGAGHTQLCTVQGTSGSVIPVFDDSGGSIVEGTTLTWRDIGITGGVPPWVSLVRFRLGSGIVDSGGHLQQVTTNAGNTGVTGGSVPTWNHAGGTTTDGAITWTDLGIAATGPALDVFAVQSAYFLQLLVRGTNDYVLYFAGARELLTPSGGGSPPPFLYARAYAAAFDGTTFGPDTLLPDQAGVTAPSDPLSAVVDAAHIVHFMYGYGGTNTIFFNDGNSAYHVGMAADGTFGATRTVSDSVSRFHDFTQSNLVAFTDTIGRIAFAANVNESGTGNPVGMHFFYAPAGALDPSWAEAVVSPGQPWDAGAGLSPYWSYSSGRVGDAITRGVSLAYASGQLVCVWNVSTNPNDVTGNSSVGSWWWSSTPATAIAWAAPALLIPAPDLLTLFPVWSASVQYHTGDVVQDGIPPLPYFVYKARVDNLNVSLGTFGTWGRPDQSPVNVYPSQPVMFPMAGGIGLVTNWQFDEESDFTQFTAILPPAPSPPGPDVVLAFPGTVLARRGMYGTYTYGKPKHPEGQLIWLGPGGYFRNSNPSGACDRTKILALPVVTIPSGIVWNCPDSGIWKQGITWAEDIGWWSTQTIHWRAM